LLDAVLPDLAAALRTGAVPTTQRQSANVAARGARPSRRVFFRIAGRLPLNSRRFLG
jgi:hypothetical protein